MRHGNDILIDKLDRFIRKYYKNELIKGFLYAGGILLLLYTVLNLLEYFGHFNQLIRAVLFYFFMLSLAAVVYRFIAIPLAGLIRIGSYLKYEDAARIIGNHFSEVADKLINTLQLKHKVSGNSNALLDACIEQKTAQLKPIPFHAAIDYRKNRKYLLWLLIPLSLLLLIGFAWPYILSEATQRIVNYDREFIPKAPFQFEILNEKLEGLTEEDFHLDVQVTGSELPEEAFIEIDGKRFRMKKSDKVHYQYLFRTLHEDSHFRFYANGFYSQNYILLARPNPVINSIGVDVDYPAYTGRTDEQIDGTGDLIVPEGSILTWHITTQSAEKLIYNDMDTVRTYLPSSRSQGSLSFTFSDKVYKSITYRLVPANKYVTEQRPADYRIKVIRDMYPTVEIEEASDTLNKKLRYFSGVATDDYGLNKLQFHCNIKHTDGASINIANDLEIERGKGRQLFYYQWNTDTFNLKPGDEVSYYFEVWDNDAVNGSKSAKSQIKVMKVPDEKELRKQQDAKDSEIRDRINNAVTESHALDKELDKLTRKLYEKKELSWDDKQQIKQILDRQHELENRINRLSETHQEKINEEKAWNKPDPELLEKQEALQKLMDEILTDEMRKKIEELQKLMDKLNKDDLQKMMEDIKLSNEDIEKELDRTLELFKQLEFRQKAEDIEKMVEDLKEAQDSLNDETTDKNNDTKALKQAQDSLNKEMEDVQKEMDQLKEKNQELEHPNKLDDVEQSMQNADQEMLESSEQLDKKQRKKSSESQKKASQSMEEMKNQLQQMMMSSENAANAEDMDALRQILDNLVQLSFDQEKLMNQLKPLDRRDPRYVEINRQQQKIKNDAAMIEDSLFALSKRQIQIQGIVNREINAINHSMDEAIAQVSNGYVNGNNAKGQALRRQQEAMTGINNLALLLDEALQQMQQQMSQQKFGSSSCNKPGGNPKPSAQSLKQLQQQLNKQIEALRKELQESQKQGTQKGGSKSGKKSGKKGEARMSKELARMAAEQEAIRKQLQQMSEQMKGGGKGNGSLDDLSKMMEETEQDLVNKQITRETIRRQREIMVRLLEHERAEREREMDNKRKAEEGKNRYSGNPEEFFEYKRLKEKEMELLQTVPPAMTPFYKQKTNKYINTFRSK